MRLLFLLPVFLIISCESANESDNFQKYFDTKSAIENIVKTNNSSKPNVNKIWEFKENNDSGVVADIDWKKELKLFLEADLNKSSYVNSYDSVSIANKVVYTLKKNEKLPIVELTVGKDSLGNMVFMQSTRISENYFFKMQSHIELRLENGKLKSYMITSDQKLLWFDTDKTKVSGTLN